MLVGRVGRADIKIIGETKIASFTLATNERYKDKNGVWAEDTTWHNVNAYGNNASVVERFVQKGSNLFVEGRIRKRKYTDRDGNEREVTEIVAQSIELLDPRSPKGDNPTEDLGF